MLPARFGLLFREGNVKYLFGSRRKVFQYFLSTTIRRNNTRWKSIWTRLGVVNTKGVVSASTTCMSEAKELFTLNQGAHRRTLPEND